MQRVARLDPEVADLTRELLSEQLVQLGVRQLTPAEEQPLVRGRHAADGEDLSLHGLDRLDVLHESQRGQPRNTPGD